ncbi:MAG: glycosyltransferase family 39 protein [Chloroflexi bacterium]|nr:glycosyltransferase family 39 protein [Chloroflexota bacterium]
MPPLEAGESLRGVSAWQLIAGLPLRQWQEPLATLATAGAFFVLGDNDYTARLGSALAGGALVALTWRMRSHLGRRPALLGTLLLATSPSLVYYSRFLSGDIYVALLTLLLAVFLFDHSEGAKKVSLPMVTIAGALLLSSGPQAIDTVIIFGGYLAARYATGSLKGWGEGHFSSWLPSGLFFLGTLFILHTAFLTYPQGLSLPSLQEWLAAFSKGGGESYLPWLQLAAYEPLALFLGLVGATQAVALWRKNGEEGFPLFLAFWATGALLLLTLRGGRAGGYILSASLPLTLLAAWSLGRMLCQIKLTDAILGLLFLGPGAALLGLNLLLLNSLSGGYVSSDYIPWAVVAWGTLALLMLKAFTTRKGRYRLLILFSAAALLELFSFHSMISASYVSPPQEWLGPPATSPDVPQAVNQGLDFLSLPRQGGDMGVAVDPALEAPFGWYLRKLPKVSITTNEDYAVAIVPQGGARLKAQGQLVWQGVVKEDPEPVAKGIGALWRWVIFREAKEVQRKFFAVYVKESR